MKLLLQLFSLLMVSSLASGCLRATPPPDYYTLAVLAPSEAAASPAFDLRLGVVLKAFPEALERMQIVTRDGFRVGLSDQHRWAAPLRQESERVLATNLGRRLGPERVAVAPWPSYFSPNRRLLVEILQFEGALCGEFELQARWVLTDGAGKVVQLQRTSMVREVAECSGYPDYVAAQSRALAQLSGEIAAALKNLPAP